MRLGCPGIVHGVVVDTAFFRGNYPPQISVEAACASGYPSPDELAGVDWQTLVPQVAAAGDTANSYPVADRRRWTHVRLSIYPDGGVARLRVHGEVVPDPRVPGRDRRPGRAGERRPGGRLLRRVLRVAVEPDPARAGPGRWARAGRTRGAAAPATTTSPVRLAAAAGSARRVDTSCFVGNAPGWVELSGASGAGGDELAWRPVLPRTRVQPDTRHRFLIDDQAEVTHVRLDVFPDGGLARLRAYGEVTAAAADALAARWRQSEP